MAFLIWHLSSWYELAVIMLKDKTNNVELTIFSEAIPVAAVDVEQLKQFTPHDFQFKWSGLSCRLPEKNFNFNSVNPTHISYETAETMLSQTRISHALRTLATLFKNKMLSQMS